VTLSWGCAEEAVGLVLAHLGARDEYRDG
jgi:hypothetical protein